MKHHKKNTGQASPSTGAIWCGRNARPGFMNRRPAAAAGGSRGRAADWESAGLRWTDHGRGFGDDPALLNAIAAFQAALEEQTREQARCPGHAPVALAALGKRESGTGRLEESAADYRLAPRI
jgi:hypothetical protein